MNAEMGIKGRAAAFDIRERTADFALSIVKTAALVPHGAASSVLIRQLLRSGTSIGANVEEAHAGFTRQDFAHSMNVARKEARESAYWLRLMKRAELLEADAVNGLIQECDELCRILTAIVKSTQRKRA